MNERWVEVIRQDPKTFDAAAGSPGRCVRIWSNHFAPILDGTRQKVSISISLIGRRMEKQHDR